MLILLVLLIKKRGGKLENKVSSLLTTPTGWFAGIVPVLKPNGKVRICADLTELNKTVHREVHPCLLSREARKLQNILQM